MSDACSQFLSKSNQCNTPLVPFISGEIREQETPHNGCSRMLVQGWLCHVDSSGVFSKVLKSFIHVLQMYLYVFTYTVLLTGYYPPSATTEYTEDTPPSDKDALSRLCRDWEASATLPESSKTRLATIRIGLVLGKEGGMIQQTIWPFWFGLGGE
jgi:hypothetical protein